MDSSPLTPPPYSHPSSKVYNASKGSLRLIRTSLLVLLDYRKRLLLMGCHQNFPVLQSDGFSILNRPGLLQQIQ